MCKHSEHISPNCLMNKWSVDFVSLVDISDPFWLFFCLQEEEERGKRQVLVLGLDGAGKSSMLQGLTPGQSTAKRGRCRPTRGFNFMSLNAPACQLDFLESKTPFIPRNHCRLSDMHVLSNSMKHWNEEVSSPVHNISREAWNQIVLWCTEKTQWDEHTIDFTFLPLKWVRLEFFVIFPP